MQANASFAALGAPDYAGKSGKAKDRIAKSVKELFANLDAAPRKVPHHSNVYLLCPSGLHCSVLFFASVDPVHIHAPIRVARREAESVVRWGRQHASS